MCIYYQQLYYKSVYYKLLLSDWLGVLQRLIIMSIHLWIQVTELWFRFVFFLKCHR